MEATQGIEGGLNHGKFLIGLFEEDEWEVPCEMDRLYGQRDSHQPMNPWAGRSLLARCGWSRDHVLVLDLQTGEGAIFLPGGAASADLDKHRVWVCPMFGPFLQWLYAHEREADVAYEDGLPVWFVTLPPLVELPAAPGAMFGYRRSGATDPS